MKKVTLIAALILIASYSFAAPAVPVAGKESQNCSLLFNTSFPHLFFIKPIQNVTEINADISPVTFTGFSAALASNNVLVQWSATERADANMYELERSEDGLSWRTIAYFGAIADSTQTNRYSFADRQVGQPVVHYRVKEVDKDGRVAYTSVQSVRVSTSVAGPQ